MRRVSRGLLAGLAILLPLSRVSGDGVPLPRGTPVAGVTTQVREAADLGRVDPSLPLERMVLVLPLRDPDGLKRLLAALQDPASPQFRRWLTPAEFGARFGAPQSDVEALVRWLQSQGFAVEGPTAGRTALVFSGQAGDVERAFGTELHIFLRDGDPRIANVLPLTLPAGLGLPDVRGLLPVHGFARREPLARMPTEFFNGYSGLGLSPADFAVLYGLERAYLSGRGSGQRIAIVARTNIRMLDIRNFRAFFGLPPRDPIVLLNGEDPGVRTGDLALLETNLDVEWSGGLAPEADVVVVVSKSTLTTDGIDLSCLYAVDQNVAGIVEVSYGFCEQRMGAEETAYFTNLWAQAAAQGITVLVSSGDSGAAGCESGMSAAGSMAAVNGLGSSPYATSVGGTQFEDGGVGPLWSPENDPETKRSVLGPVPEVAWNQSGTVSGGAALLASGGGSSIVHARPAWQSVPGTPAGTRRLVPDVAVNAGGSVPYYIVTPGFGLFSVFGTSASAPAFAGIAALWHERAGERLGCLNPSLYALGRLQYAEGTLAAFRDVTSGDNSVPGVEGFRAGSGYDAVTGLGSLDAAALAEALETRLVPWYGVDFDLTASPAAVSLAPGERVDIRLSLSSTNGADPLATISVDSPPGAVRASLAPGRASADSGLAGYVSAGVPATLQLTAAEDVAPEAFVLNVAATAGSVVRRVAILVRVGDAALPSPGVELQVPAVVDVPGVGGARFTSDLVAANRSGTDATLLFRFVPSPGAPGEGGPVIGRSLPAGRQFYSPWATAYLAGEGYDFSGGDPRGTLFVTFAGVRDPSAVFAGARTSTPNPNGVVGGTFGTFAPGVPAGRATSDETWVYGLREGDAYRSNLALVHAPSADGAPEVLAVEIQLFDGDEGAPAGPPLRQELAPGEYAQLNRVLAKAPGRVSNGYARLRRVAGKDRFITYGVVNDGGAGGGGTSDGSFIASGGTGGLLPVVLDLPGLVHYQTELTLTNPSPETARTTLEYTPAPLWGKAGGGTATVDLSPGEQLHVPNAIEFLRRRGLAIPAGRQGGTLLVTGAAAQARTFNPNPDPDVGGTFGLSYPAVGAADRATREAFVFGLRQDASARANVAIADARIGGGTVDYVVEVFDAAGSPEPAATFTRSLSGGEWHQFDGILARAGLASGYVRVRPAVGRSDFVAYGVVNDGAASGTGTSDGSYLPMVVVD